MKIIKDRQIISRDWIHIADDEPIVSKNISVSLARWKKDKLESSQGNIGVRLAPADKVEHIAKDLKHIKLIALEFSIFTDGRCFSQARLLRSRYGFKNEILALGNYLPDQVFYLSRVGVNSFQLENSEQLELALSTLDDFTFKYQLSTN